MIRGPDKVRTGFTLTEFVLAVMLLGDPGGDSDSPGCVRLVKDVCPNRPHNLKKKKQTF